MIARLGDICEKKIDTIKAAYKGDIDYVDISSIDNQRKIITQIQSMSIEDAPSRAKQLVFPGDILVSTVRPNLNAVALITKNTDNALVASTGYCVLRCLPNADNKYVFYFCQSPTFIEKLVVQATGASYPAVTSAIIRECALPFPPLEEQRKIAAVLDKVSGLIAKRRQQLDKLDELVKSRFIEMFGDVPEEEKVTIAEICKIITDGTHQPPKFTNTGIPFLFVSNIITNDICYDAEKFISEETYAELIKRTPIEIGDILLSTVGSYGHPAIVKTDRRFCFQRHIAYLKPKSDMVKSEYLRGAILSDNVQRQIDERVKGIAQKTLNLSEIRKIRLPLPPMKLQEKFTTFVVQTDKSKLVIQKSLERLEILKKALMQEYFVGGK